MRCAVGAALAAALGLALCPALARAANPACDARIRLRPDGSAEVSGEFSGLPAELTALELFSGTKDAGVLKLAVAGGRAEFRYSSAHQLHHEPDGLYLGSPDFYVPGASLDLRLSVQYPPQYALLGAEPEPTDRGLGSLRWEAGGAAHFVAVLRFERRGGLPGEGLSPAEVAAPAEEGSQAADESGPGPAPAVPPPSAFDPAELPPLRPGEEAQSAQQLLEELAFAIKLARAEGQSDAGFLDALEKLLAKLHAFFEKKGMLDGEKHQTQ